MAHPHGGMFSASNGKDIPPPAATRMDLEDVVLREISRSRGDEHRMIPLTGGPWGTQIIETDSGWWGSEAGGGGDGELVFHGAECPLGR